VPAFDLPGALRRIRRLADLSQRELGRAAGVSQSAIAQAESGRRDLPVGTLAAAAGLAGLRLALLDTAGNDVPVMAPDRARDLGRRRFPAHLDPLHTDEFGRSYEPRRDRPESWFTFYRDRGARDSRRQRDGTPVDHPEFDAESSPTARAAARRAARRRAAAEEAFARLSAGSWPRVDDGWSCRCPRACDELDDWSGRPVHVEDCPCSCDLG
jgi:transcriptional regulator with XRE-family HTH domain